MTSRTINIYGGRDPRDLPAYGVAEAAYFLRVPKATISRWVSCRGNTRPVIDPARHNPTSLSFYNLVELHVLKAMRQEHELPLQRIRDAILYVEATLKLHRPLVHEQFKTDGVNLFLEKYGELIDVSNHGQKGIRKVLVELLKRVEWDERGLARELSFYANDPDEPRIIVANPLISFGRPVLAGTRIPVDVLTSLKRAGDSAESIAKVYKLTAHQVESALAWELPRAAA